MLTKDLARYRIQKGMVKPGFIDAQDAPLLLLAEQLLSVFQQGLGLARGEIEEETDRFVQAFPGDAVIGRGLAKLLFDRATFTTPDDEVLPEFRATLFATGGRLLSEQLFATPEDYYRRLETEMGQPLPALRDTLFADLPANHPLEAFREITPGNLLHRYNLSLVQWLLLHTGQLEITLEDAKPKNLRQVLKYLRFNQLFARIDNEGKSWRLRVDGPLNLFGAARRYGMQLGRFFPALLHQERWRLHAEVKPKNKTVDLVVDHTMGLKALPGKFHAYVPDEVHLFTRSFKEKVAGWSLAKDPGFVPLPGELYCFPDFLFVHESGLKVALELFHPWHQAHLPGRLAQLADLADTPLLVGVARKCMKKAEVLEATEGNPYFQRWGFSFNDMPTIRHLAPLLTELLG